MLAISRALLGRPQLLMLDEPTEGVWIGVIEEIADRLVELSRRDERRSSSSSMSSWRCGWRRPPMSSIAGRSRLQGPAAAVRDDPALLRFLAP